MSENDEKLKKKRLYSYSEDEDSVDLLDSMNNFRYQYSDDIVVIDKEVNKPKKDRTFAICLIASCLNILFGFLFFMNNLEASIKGVTYFGGKFILNAYSLKFLFVFLILFVLSIASFTFSFLYKESKIIGILGIIVCGLACFLCLFVEFFPVIVQLILYIAATIMFFNNNIKNNTALKQSF